MKKTLLLFLLLMTFVTHAATPQKITLDMHHLPLRSAIEWFAKFHHQNFIMSPEIHGDVTLYLHQVSWQHAFSLLLKSHGLASFKEGNIVYVAPRDEILKRQQAIAKTVAIPLKMVIYRLNYASAKTVGALLQEKKGHFISTKGSVAVDVRTNSLIIEESPKQLRAIRHLIQALDRPVKQVLIQARIVNIDNSYEKSLGIQYHLIGGNLSLSNDLSIDLPTSVTEPAHLGLAVFRLAKGTLLDLELSALESEGKAKVISTPRLLTADQQAASIESGEEIPYQQSAGGDGATTVAFKKAVLKLAVTPHITPNNQLLLNLEVVQDKRSSAVTQGAPAIDTHKLKTEVLVKNRETIVLGGVYEDSKVNGRERVPFFSRIPLIGALFRHKEIIRDRRELLIFITPKIIN